MTRIGAGGSDSFGIARGDLLPEAEAAVSEAEAPAATATRAASSPGRPQPPIGARDADASRTHGRSVTSMDGTVLRDEAWRVGKREHVDTIHAFTERHPCTALRFMSLLSDINFSRGVYAEAEVMSLVNDYLAPVDAQGKPRSPAWGRYIEAAERGASDLELSRVFFDAHNEALAAAEKDPRYQAARAAAPQKLLTLCDVTLAMSHDMQRELNEQGADATLVMMGGMRRFFEAHVQAGVVPLRMSDIDLMMRASDLSPLEVMLDKMRGEATDEVVMARAMRTTMIISESYLQDRLDGVRGFMRRLVDRFR